MDERAYKWWVVAMLWFVCFFNYADRQAVFSVFPLLEKELGLNTVKLGLLGSSFAITYGICAPFAGAIVDRVRRVAAVLWGLYTWSLICMATAVWIAAGVVSTGGVSALAVVKLLNKKTSEQEQEGNHDEQ